MSYQWTTFLHPSPMSSMTLLFFETFNLLHWFIVPCKPKSKTQSQLLVYLCLFPLAILALTTLLYIGHTFQGFIPQDLIHFCKMLMGYYIPNFKWLAHLLLYFDRQAVLPANKQFQSQQRVIQLFILPETTEICTLEDPMAQSS